MEHPPLWAALALTAALASGCATQGYTDMGYQPIVDLQPSQRATYSADLHQCSEFAQQRIGAQLRSAGYEPRDLTYRALEAGVLALQRQLLDQERAERALRGLAQPGAQA